MKEKKLFILTAGLLVLLAMLVTSLAGCTVSVNVSTASLSEATTCKSVDQQTKRPVEKTDIFSADITEIFCSVKVSNAPPETQITAVWVYIQGEAKDLKNYKIAEYTLQGSGTRYLSFSITRPDKGWPIGDYEVKLFVAEKEKLTVPFKVQSGSAVPGGEVYLSEATMCKSIDSTTAVPIEKADVFTPNTPIIYCSVKLSNAPPNTEVKAQWVYVTKNTVLYEDVGMESGTYYLAFQLQPPQNGWPVGNYVVKLFLNGQEKFTVPFKVQ
jgi:hypothetical protein